MITKIRLEFDYECNPLWDISHPEKGINSLDYSEVGIPDELQYSLSKLNKEYQLTYNLKDPMNSGFRSKEDAMSFIKKVKNISFQLKNHFNLEEVIIPDLEDLIIN